MTLSRVGPALLLIAIAGCGASNGVPSGGGDGAASGTSDANALGTDGGAPGQVGIGVIDLSSWDYVLAGTPQAGMSASATFLSFAANSSGGAGCPTTTDGPCAIDDCPIFAADAGVIPPKNASAGTVHVAGGSVPLQLVPSGSTYAPAQGPARLWNGGEQLDVMADGADVPSFDLKVTAPSYVTVTAPAWPAVGAKIAIDRTQSLPIAWSGGSDGTVQVGIYALTSTRSTSVTCGFPASSGSGSVPPSVLAKIPAAPTSASISVYCASDARAVLGGWVVLLHASATAKTGAGNAVAPVTIP
jgi:hypothetical protein